MTKLDFSDIKEAVSNNYLAVQEITKDTYKGIDKKILDYEIASQKRGMTVLTGATKSLINSSHRYSRESAGGITLPVI